MVFWWFLQTYMTSGRCSSWFFLVVKSWFFWCYFGLQAMAIHCRAAKNSLSGTLWVYLKSSGRYMLGTTFVYPTFSDCAAHVCTLFSSTVNPWESYGSHVYQGMQPSREKMWVGSYITALWIFSQRGGVSSRTCVFPPNPPPPPPTKPHSSPWQPPPSTLRCSRGGVISGFKAPAGAFSL